jgi:hypothetical protein
MKHMNNLKFIEATNESHPRPARPASIPLTREAEAIGGPTLILAASGGLMEADTVSPPLAAKENKNETHE